jgi:hypothetical protein
MSIEVEMNELKASAELARALFVDAANRAIAKCYDEDVCDNASRSAVRWLQIADGLDNAARRKHAELCGVEV